MLLTVCEERGLRLYPKLAHPPQSGVGGHVVVEGGAAAGDGTKKEGALKK